MFLSRFPIDIKQLFRIAIIICLLVPGFLSQARGQQFVTDDAAVVGHKSFQVEAWYGEYSSWLLPAWGVFKGVELTPGLGYIQDGEGDYEFQWVLQLKYIPVEIEPGKTGFGIVAGTGMAPFTQPGRRSFNDLYAYGVLGRSFFGDALHLHGNLGWIFENDADPGFPDHLLTWGLRSDVAISDRITWIAESFSGGYALPEMHTGLRFTLIQDLLEMDISYGMHTDKNETGIGFNIGLAWTP